MTYIEVIPYVAAPGRDYTSQAEMRADWDGGKDFTVVEWDGRPVRTTTSKSDIAAMNARGEDIRIIGRYAKLRKTMILKA